MDIHFHCRDDEAGPITSLKIAEALINHDGITVLDLEELSRYLEVYVTYSRRRDEEFYRGESKNAY